MVDVLGAYIGVAPESGGVQVGLVRLAAVAKAVHIDVGNAGALGRPAVAVDVGDTVIRIRAISGDRGPGGAH